MPRPARHAHELNVLVVTALPALGDRIRELLDGEGYAVSDVRTADEAIERAQIEPPDLILLFLGRTESPMQVIEKLHRRSETQDVPVVAMGGSRESGMPIPHGSADVVLPVLFDPQLLIEHIWQVTWQTHTCCAGWA
jgi:CheY-like chemotaxis protein